MYPLKFAKVLKPKVWGGREFEALWGVPLEPGKPYGESWEVSAHPNGPSVVTAGAWVGRTLPELVTLHGASLLGKPVMDRFGGQFPLLIKYLDIHDKLSIQVHPDDGYALKHEGEFGKSECWYVLAASTDAKLILGVAPGVTKEEFARRSHAGQWQGLFREVSVAAGDFVHIVPGTVHASVAGSVVLCEIQQNSDTTYRIYDFDRLEDGKRRELQLDKALDVIRFGETPRVVPAGARPRVPLPGGVLETLVKDPCFTVDRLEITATWKEPVEDRFKVLSVLDGGGAIVHAGKAWLVQEGETWFLPAGLEVSLQGVMTLLRSTV